MFLHFFLKAKYSIKVNLNRL